VKVCPQGRMSSLNSVHGRNSTAMQGCGASPEKKGSYLSAYRKKKFRRTTSKEKKDPDNTAERGVARREGYSGPAERSETSRKEKGLQLKGPSTERKNCRLRGPESTAALLRETFSYFGQGRRRGSFETLARPAA